MSDACRACRLEESRHAVRIHHRPISTQTSIDDPVEKSLATVGRVHPHVEIKVIDPHTGEVVLRDGANVTQRPDLPAAWNVWRHRAAVTRER